MSTFPPDPSKLLALHKMHSWHGSRSFPFGETDPDNGHNFGGMTELEALGEPMVIVANELFARPGLEAPLSPEEQLELQKEVFQSK